jgi:lipoprotein-anchoring transpeptidase ErfK/SrfK
MVHSKNTYLDLAYSISISISSQSLTVYQGSKLINQYAISTALKGVGSQKNSNKTPLGKHLIRAKIGAGLPINSVLVGRRATGEVYNATLAEQFPQRDWILSRILWLSGKQVGQNRLGNVDTMQRYIYIHGTPDSEPMSRPLSHGCVRMRNVDLIELFNLVPVYTPVDITE